MRITRLGVIRRITPSQTAPRGDHPLSTALSPTRLDRDAQHLVVIADVPEETFH